MTIASPHMWETAGIYDPDHPIHQALDKLVWEALSLRDSFGPLTAAARADAAAAEERFAAIRHMQPMAATARLSHTAPAASQVEYVHARADAHQTAAFSAIIGRTLLVSLVSAYDTFLGNLLRAQFKTSPEHLRNGQSPLLPRDVLGLTPEAIAGLVAEREVANLLHSGRGDQLKALAKLARTQANQLLSGCADELNEICERRNLCAHTGGRISQHYLDACGPAAGPGRPGDQIHIDADYYAHACETVIVAAVVLSQKIWRARRADTLSADVDLRHLAYTLLVLEQWPLATRVLQFAVETVQCETAQLVVTVNLAQAHKWQEDAASCAAVLASRTWRTLEPAYRLAHAVLTDRFDDAAELMRAAILCRDIDRSAFDHWPLFRQFRQSDQFRAVYHEMFGGPCRRNSLQLDLLADIPAQPSRMSTEPSPALVRPEIA